MSGEMPKHSDWQRVSTASGPGDRAAAEAGVRLAYRRAGLPEPEHIVWARSPLEAVRMLRGEIGPRLPKLGASVRETVRSTPWATARSNVLTELGQEGFSTRWQSTGAPLWELTRLITDRITGAILAGSADDRQEQTEIRLLLLDAVQGQHDAAWLAAFDTSRPPLDGIAAVAREAGWWWPYTKVAVITERPAELHRDESGRLDRSDGPALAYSDGFALYAWRGMPVPAEFLDRLGSLTPQQIRTEENAELRRVMLEFYGYDRYLAESGAEPVHHDETGVLWRIRLDGDEDVVMVEVVNSTPEPDGTNRTYWLRVPPLTRTARQGVAWTFGVDEDAYEPIRQT